MVSERKNGHPAAAPRLWILDLDDTLYCASAGMFREIHRRMRGFISERLGLDEAAAAALQHRYWELYGTTFLGLVRHHGIAPQEFLSAAHDFDVRPYLVTCRGTRRLRAAVAALPGRKVVLTNGPGEYARRVLAGLHLQGLFDFVMSADEKLLGQWRSKPDAVMFAACAARAGTNPRDAVLVEDSLRALKTAKRLGMKTVWCTGFRRAGRSPAAPPCWVDAAVANIEDMAGRM